MRRPNDVLRITRYTPSTLTTTETFSVRLGIDAKRGLEALADEEGVTPSALALRQESIEGALRLHAGERRHGSSDRRAGKTFVFGPARRQVRDIAQLADAVLATQDERGAR